jgi:PAS domain S-box-containing protein
MDSSFLEKKILLIEKENKALRQKIKSYEENAFVDLKWSQSIIDSIPNPVFIKNSNYQFVAVNTALCSFLGKLGSELIGKSDSDFFSKEQAEVFFNVDEQVLLTGKTNWNEEDLTVDGILYNLLTSKVLITDSRDNKYILGVITDITDNKNQQVQLIQKTNELEKEKENVQNLLKEVHHRVKNNLQIISSLINLQRENFSEGKVQLLLNNSANRVNAMAKVHDILYRSESFAKVDFKKYIISLVDSITDSSVKLKEAVEFKLNLKGVYLDVNLAVPLGMICNEIITNSIQHAKRLNDKLVVDISTVSLNGSILIKIGDNGIGDKSKIKKTNESLGIELIYLLCGQINSEVELITNSEEVRFTINVPYSN